MTIVREKREPLTYDDHRRAAISAGIWAVVPIQLFLRALDALTTDWWALFYILYPTALMVVFIQVAILAAVFLAVGLLVARALVRAEAWTWYPLALTGSILSLSAVSLTWWGNDAWPQLWFLGLVAIIGAHAGWRYYLRLCTEKESAA